MSVTCQDLLTLKYFERIKLVAGPNGLDRTVTWPYVGQTSTVSQWVHGGELLFITGIVHSADKLKDLILECIQKKLAGLVILVGNEYINSIPEELLAQADAADFPLFEMPWDVKLIDVTREITDLIMRDKFEIKKSKNFLGRLLFASDVDYRQMLDTAIINDIHLLEYKFIAVFNVSHPADEIMTDAGHDSLEDKLQHSVDSLCKEKQLPVTTLVYGNNVICLASAPTQEKAAEAAAYLETVCGLLSQLYSGSNLYLSFGRPYADVEQIKISYQEAQKALLLWKRWDAAITLSTIPSLVYTACCLKSMIKKKSVNTITIISVCSCSMTAKIIRSCWKRCVSTYTVTAILLKHHRHCLFTVIHFYTVLTRSVICWGAISTMPWYDLSC